MWSVSRFSSFVLSSPLETSRRSGKVMGASLVFFLEESGTGDWFLSSTPSLFFTRFFRSFACLFWVQALLVLVRFPVFSGFVILSLFIPTRRLVFFSDQDLVLTLCSTVFSYIIASERKTKRLLCCIGCFTCDCGSFHWA